MPIFSWSTLVLGSMETWITGSGKSMDSRITGLSSEQIVCPVRTSLKPTAAPMSPVRTSSMSSRLLACICSRRPMRSRRPLLAL